MKPDDLKLSDLQRILIGEIPASFFIELIFRAAVIYIILIIAMRLMGKRMASQISRNEMAAVTSLAAAVGIPLMNPDRGLLPGIVITAVIVIFTVFISWRSSRNEKFETLTQDDLSILVSDGVMDLKKMQQIRVTREMVFAQLRLLQKTHLGMVKRLYMEANGLFSLVEEKQPKPGLLILPESDPEFIERKVKKTDLSICYQCGKLADQAVTALRTPCPHCGTIHWTKAVN